MSALTDRSILIVEDEYFVAKDIKRVLIEWGATVLGPVPSLEAAMALIEATSEIDGAILDVNLGGEMIFPAADLLLERSVALVFTTGYDQSAIPARFGKSLRCEKPVDAEKVCQTLASALA